MRVSPSCRDKGWMWRRVGALCLSSSQHDSLGLRDASPDDAHPTRTSTRPPTSTPPGPLSLQDEGERFLHYRHYRFWLSKIIIASLHIMPLPEYFIPNSSRKETLSQESLEKGKGCGQKSLCSPHLDRLITACTDQGLAIGAEYYTPNSTCMAGKGSQFLAGGKAPHSCSITTSTD